jgi:hypothetical protein
MEGLQLNDIAEKCGACGTYGQKRGAYRVLVEKPEGKRLLGRNSRKNHISIYLPEVRWRRGLE